MHTCYACAMSYINQSDVGIAFVCTAGRHIPGGIPQRAPRCRQPSWTLHRRVGQGKHRLPMPDLPNVRRAVTTHHRPPLPSIVNAAICVDCYKAGMLWVHHESNNNTPSQETMRGTTFSCTSPTLAAAATAATQPLGSPLAFAPTIGPRRRPQPSRFPRTSLRSSRRSCTPSCASSGCTAACWGRASKGRPCSRRPHGKVRSCNAHEPCQAPLTVAIMVALPTC